MATYACGPSYGWQNLRLCAQSSLAAELWHPAAAAASDDGAAQFTHPADLARTGVIAKALEETGQSAGSARLRAEWDALLAHAGKPPETYAATYPASVLGELVAMTLDWCRVSGLRAFGDAKPTSIVSRIDHAWREQLSPQGPSAKAEASRVKNLRAQIWATA